MSRLRYSVLIVVATVMMLGWTALSTCSAQDEQPWIELLQSDAPKADKALTCKKLAVWGTERAVPALAALLPDPELTSWARIALEAMPGTAADDALRAALDQVEGLTLIGVINSIGVRRDPRAVQALQARLGDADAGVACAAAVALGCIGDEAAIAALRAALPAAPVAVRAAVAEGCILSAERLMENGHAEQAVGIYDEVCRADVPKQRLMEATRGAILARGSEGIPLLIEQLTSGDRHRVAIALAAARELTGTGVSQQLVAALPDMAADQQAAIILALADRGDADVMPAMLAAAQSGPETVRRAAIEVLKRVGDATCIPVLLTAAATGSDDIAQAARNTLKDLPGDDVNVELLGRLESAGEAERIVLLELVGLRRIDAVPPLLTAVDDGNARIRAAALYALGEVASLEDVAVLVARVVEPAHAEDAAVAVKALQAACVRMPDRESCAQLLSSSLAQASLPAKLSILETLKSMGGTKALETVAQYAHAADAQLEDAATRLLGDWMSVDAGPVLLQLAKSSDSRYKVRALRGYLRLVRQFTMPDSQRVAMCRDAWDVAERDAERTLVLQAMERYASVDMLRLATDLAQGSVLQNEVTACALAIAQKVGGSADVQQLLELIQREPVNIEILAAQYGAGETQRDVTAILRQYVGDFPLIVLPTNNYNASFGGDPVPNVVKRLTVRYRMDGKTGEAVFAENETILLPMPR